MGRKSIALRAALSLGLLLLAPAGAHAAGWSAPFRLAGPFTDDVTAPSLAISSRGEAAVSFAIQDEDQPWVSHAMLVLRSTGGKLTRLKVPGVKEVLAAAFAGSTLEILSGTGSSCCDGAAVSALSGRRFEARRTLVRGLFGLALGELVPLGGAELLAAIATERAVLADGVLADGASGAHARGSGARAGGAFGKLRTLSPASSWPQALATASLSGGRGLIAWSSAPGLTEQASSIDIAIGSVKHPARRPSRVVPVPATYSVDELAAAPGPQGATVAWVQSFFDATGTYRSQMVVADLTRTLQPRTYEIPGEIAGGLSLAGDDAGAQVLTWRACGPLGSCTVFAMAKGAHGQYGRPQALGAIDASEAPVATICGGGTALVGWIDQGQVLFSSAVRGTAAFGPAEVVSPTSYAADLTLAPAPRGRALAAWVQGTLAPSVMGAAYRP